MSKHTPGPWGFGWLSTNGLTGKRCSPTVYLDIDTNQIPIHHNKNGQVYPVAWILVDGDDELAMGDARLIAAAPELLDALLDCERNMIISTQADMDRLDRIRSAIAKATGA